MESTKIRPKSEVLNKGIEFDGEIICYAGEYGQQVCDSSKENAPVTGIIYELFPNGNLNYYCGYTEGIQNGECIEFYVNGAIKMISSMRMGVVHGSQVSWYENGKHKSESIMKYGFLVSCKEWDESGNLTRELNEPGEFERKMIEQYDKLDEG